MHFKAIIVLAFSQTLLFAQTIGLASWYGEKFQGRITSSGETFNMHAYTAAHKTLPFGTMVNVTNLQNGKSVNVKVNDRGPYNSNRIMDISYAAAKSIGLVTMGTAKVSIEQFKTQPIRKVTVQPRLEPTANTSTILETVTASKDLASMMEYALMITDPKKEVNQPVVVVAPTTVAVPPVVNQKKKVHVQVASFSTEQGAEQFMVKERSKGYQMMAIPAFSIKFQQLRHKVIILTDSKKSAMAIVNSKQYNGAYILK
ncbi:MAG: Rare lipoprotein A precursor [uncultured Sulfurovum sp.]|uniref:Probable endolytic peptidoglycan transglycosylase RlpA n=1 Tax=uncultured Sulfurovum sp. TaxID=269237 RepID=A0A6S6S9D0_9BACT|nr:MAG: Rare lipoprotein A precursor [uncultured Sulfurovum sp.]